MKSKVKNYKKRYYSRKGGKPTRLEAAEKSRSDMSEYYKQMDNSMKEKIDVILNNINIIDESDELVIWDIGTGTGNLLIALYKSLKSIYPNLNLYMIGIDLMETSIMSAIDNANKDDITRAAITNGKIVFEISNATDIKKTRFLKRANYIIYSSIINEIYSYTETIDSNYVCSEIKRIQSVEKALELAYQILKPKGKVLIRDFIRPDNANEIVNVAFKKSEYQTICSIFEKFIDDHRTQSRHYFLFTLIYPSCKTLM